MVREIVKNVYRESEMKGGLYEEESFLGGVSGGDGGWCRAAKRA